MKTESPFVGILIDPEPIPEPIPTETLVLDIAITSPNNNQDVRSPVVITGTVSCEAHISFGPNHPPVIIPNIAAVQKVEVKYGTSAYAMATPTGPNGNWSSWTISKSRSQGSLSVTAKVTAIDAEGDVYTETATRSNLFVDTTSPTLTINPPPDATTPDGSGNYVVTVSGTASDNRNLQVVEWHGGNGSFQPVRNITGNWSSWDAQVTLPQLGTKTVTVRAKDKAGNTKTSSVVVRALDTTGPNLDITQPHENDVFTLFGEAVLVRVEGTTVDSQSGIQAVRWHYVGEPTFNMAVPQAPGNWSTWHAEIPFTEAGAYAIEIEARDAEDNPATQTIVINIAAPFDTDDPLEIISAPAYLEDLLTFAAFRVEHAAAPLTNQDWTDAFHQPFALLMEKEFRPFALQSVSQVRLCVEVLRRYLAVNGRALPAEAEHQYRRLAYITLLRNLGTSFEALRLARVADAATRTALAQQLGIILEPSRPDFLDALTLDPNQLTEADLERLFGLVNTTRDPATLNDVQTPELLLKRQEQLRDYWLQQDNKQRTIFNAARPVIDPDLLFETDFVDPTPDNRAYDLWLERQTWMNALLDELRARRDAAATPLAGLETIFAEYLAPLTDLQTLYTQYQEGDDITVNLQSYRLELQPFLYLMLFHELLTTGTPVLEEEWDQLFSIVGQAEKQGQFDTWRAEEQATEHVITLSPDFFKPAFSGPLPLWRAGEQSRRNWEATLEARIEQAAALVQSLQMVIAATEESVLPQLREQLVARAAEAIISTPTESDLAEIANRLSHELAIDVRNSGNQRTTRIHQAIETVQSALFSLRTGRFVNLNPILGSSPAAQWAFEVGYEEAEFDEEWRWMGTHTTWRTAMFVFGYPENYLLPNLRVVPTNAFRHLVAAVQNEPRLTPAQARKLINGAEGYLPRLVNEKGAQPISQITEQLTETQFAAWRTASRAVFLDANGNERFASPHDAGVDDQEIFYFVPMLMALQLQKAGHYLAALDWFRLVYAYEQPLEARKIYYGLEQEGDITSVYQKAMGSWLLTDMNPHTVARNRQNAYSRFTLMSLVRGFLDFADSEFTQDTREALARARTLYLTALDLLDLPEMQPPVDANGNPASLFPANPLLLSLRYHAELNLAKLRSGRNIAGLERQILAPEETAQSLLPTIGSGGQLVTQQTSPQRSTLYRYSVLMERAKQLVNIAQQIEAALLSAIEKRDDEEYHLLKARQDLQLVQASVQLQALRVTEAKSGIKLADLQRGRSQLQTDHFQNLLNTGLSQLEKQTLAAMEKSLTYQRVATAFTDFNTMFNFMSVLSGNIFGNPLEGLTSSLNARAQEASTLASLRETKASFERREQEWRFQKQLAQYDVLTGEQQIVIAENQLGVVQQEQFIAEMQAGYAAETLNFLANKFTNADLYEWMSNILSRVYSYFLQQATAMAKLAERQLAFERQELPPAFIRADYWQPPSDAAAIGNNQTPDRRGLTGSVRLLQDIFQLDQYAFETKKRKLQLSQTLSLAQLAPSEFQQFRETGVLRFNTPTELFDQAFPGHYLRLIKRVRVSVVALIPPTQGIRATLASSGLSRVVVGQDTFQSLVIQREPELIAFTSPSNATGLLELEPEDEMLLPFEGMGVEAAWELQLPQAANPFNYDTLADVLFTVEYTALNSFTYRQQIIQRLDRTISADRMFNFRDTFADQWFDLHNPEQTATPMIVRFDIRREDFPPHVEGLRIQHVALYFARKEGVNVEVPLTHLLLTPQGETEAIGGGSASIAGIISTRRGNANAWLPMIGVSPVGSWELSLDGTLPNGRPVAALFDDEAVADILLLITYTGQTPAWPL